jgi:hypothetical protein
MYLGSSGYVTGSARTVIIGESDEPIKWGGNGSLVVYDTITSGNALFLAKKVSSSSVPLAMFSSGANDRFTFNDSGVARFHTYGAGLNEASDLGLGTPTHIAAFAPSGAGVGTVLDLGIGTGLAISGGVLTATASAPTQILAESYNTITSTTSPQTLSSTGADNLINQGGTQATFTLNLPASPVDGQVCMITYNNAITTLTIGGNGNTIVGSAVTTAVAGSQRKFKFYSGIGWIKQY